MQSTAPDESEGIGEAGVIGLGVLAGLFGLTVVGVMLAYTFTRIRTARRRKYIARQATGGATAAAEALHRPVHTQRGAKLPANAHSYAPSGMALITLSVMELMG